MNILSVYDKGFRKQNNWRIRYIGRLIDLGYEKKDAIKTCDALDEIDYETKPESAADDEASYWN